MAKTGIIAINIIDESSNVLLSNRSPIIFDWQGEGDMIETIMNDSSFYDYLCKNILNTEKYTSSSICLSSFIKDDEDVDGDNDKSETKTINIQKLFSLEKLDSIDNNLTLKFLSGIYEKLYSRALNGEKFIPDEVVYNELDSYISRIKLIHKRVNAKYGDRFILSTELNFVRSILTKKFSMDNTNIKYLLEKLNNILNE